MNGRILDSSNNDPDLIYYDLVESYMSSTREILNGFMTFERGLIRILNNRIIFRHLAPAPVAPTPVVASEPASAPASAPASPAALAPVPAPARIVTPIPAAPTGPLTATFVRYRLPLPSVTTRATRGIATPNLSVSLSSSPPHSPPPPPPLQSLSPIYPINSRINSYEWLNFIETNNINNINSLNSINSLNGRDANLSDFQQRVQQQQRVQEQQRVQQEQRVQQQQIESDLNHVSYDTIQNATKLIPFCTIIDPKNEICPISQIQFEEIDCIMQIKYCKHNFNPYSLFRWLDSNSTCPMCRYNLNLYSNNNNNNNANARIDNHQHHSDYEMSESESESEFD